jgi:hypothetical protein
MPETSCPFLCFGFTEAGELKSQTAPSSPRFGVENEPIKIGAEVNRFLKFFLIIFLGRFQRRNEIGAGLVAKKLGDFSDFFRRSGRVESTREFFW